MARPRQALLSRERIVAAAAALIDAEGLDALSTRRLAAELGVRGPVAVQPLRHQGRDPRRGRRRRSSPQVDISMFGRTATGGTRCTQWGASYRRGAARPTRTSCRSWPGPGPPAGRAGHGRRRLRRPGRRRLAARRGPPTSARSCGTSWPARRSGSFARGFVDDPTLYADRLPAPRPGPPARRAPAQRRRRRVRARPGGAHRRTVPGVRAGGRSAATAGRGGPRRCIKHAPRCAETGAR